MSVWPPGQEKFRSPGLVGSSVWLPTRLPFLSAVKSPELDPAVWNVLLFDADGFLPPPLTHS